MVWVGSKLRDHLVPTPLPWARTPTTRSGCSKPHPTWPSALPGRGHSQLLDTQVTINYIPYIIISYS